MIASEAHFHRLDIAFSSSRFCIDTVRDTCILGDYRSGHDLCFLIMLSLSTSIYILGQEPH